MQTESTPRLRTRLGHHFRNNLVGYAALVIAVSMTPLPSYAAGVLVGTNGIANGAVTTPKLHNNAVTSPKIANGTIKKVDLANGAKAYTSIVTKVTTNAGLANGATSDRDVFCPAGTVAIGGGAYVANGLIGGAGGVTSLSLPVVSGGAPFFFVFPAGAGAKPEGWRTVITNNTGSAHDTYHYAMCASK